MAEDNLTSKEKATLTSLLTAINEMKSEEREQVLNYIAKKGITERREHPRYKCEISVSLDPEREEEGEDSIKNYSAGGLLINTNKKFSVGDEINMSFILPSEDNPLISKGTIARVEDDYIGVKFDISDFETGLISSLVVLHAE